MALNLFHILAASLNVAVRKDMWLKLCELLTGIWVSLEILNIWAEIIFYLPRFFTFFFINSNVFLQLALFNVTYAIYKGWCRNSIEKDSKNFVLVHLHPVFIESINNDGRT